MHAHTHIHTHTHTATTTIITHLKAWADLDFISDTVTVKRQWVLGFGNISTIENHRANHAVNGVWFGNNAYTRLITHMQIRYNAICNGFWRGFNMKIEPRHDKTKKDLCAQRKLRSAWASAQSDQCQRCPPEAKVGPVLPTERTAKTLIRLGTIVILMVLSWGGSKCFFLETTYTFHHISIEPNMKSFSHTNNIVLRRDICIHSLNWC